MEENSILTELQALEKEMAADTAARTSIDKPIMDDAIVTEPDPVEEPDVVETDEPETPNGGKPEPEPDTTPAPGDKPVETPTVDVDAVVDSWDAPDAVSDNTDPKPTDIDFSDVAKALGETEIKTKEDLVKVVTEYKTKQAELEQRVSSIPDNLAKAIEIANLGGNYLEYLGVAQTDWSKTDPVQLYEDYVIDNSADANGNVDIEKINEFLDNLSDVEKEVRGRDLQRQYMNYQSNTKSQLEAQAKAQKAAFEQNVRSEVNKLSDVAGFKLSQLHKDQIYKDIVTGADQKYESVEDRIVTAFLRKNFKKIDSFRKTQIRNATLREVLSEAQMPDLPTSVESPAIPSTPKKYSFDEYIADLDTKKL